MKTIRTYSVLFIITLLSVFYFQYCEDKSTEVSGQIEGIVLDSETRDPIAEVNVSLVSNSDATFLEQRKFTDPEGKFSFSDLEEGNYKLSFQQDGYAGNSKNINVTVGNANAGNILLNPIKAAFEVSPAFLDFGVATNALTLEIKNTEIGRASCRERV